MEEICDGTTECLVQIEYIHLNILTHRTMNRMNMFSSWRDDAQNQLWVQPNTAWHDGMYFVPLYISVLYLYYILYIYIVYSTNINIFLMFCLNNSQWKLNYFLQKKGCRIEGCELIDL